MFRCRLAAVAAAATIALVQIPSAGAAASGPIISPARSVSGLSPFEVACSGAVGAAHDSEVEPHVAVNPADPENVVAAWIQDRFASHGGGQSNAIAFTTDGGATWSQRAPPGIARCAGGEWQRGTDPWLDVGPDGTIYLATLSFDGQLNATWRRNALTVSRSTDGGATWSEPVVVIDDPAIILNDKEAITADPTRPGSVYLVWARFVGVNVILYLSRSTDGGDTWEQPLPMATVAPTGGQGNEILVTPDGTLVDVFYSGSSMYAIRSTDAGETWSLPTAIASLRSEPVRSPDQNRPIRSGGFIPSADIGKDGTIYVTWEQVNHVLDSDIVLVSSSDGGLTWTDPLVVHKVASQAFLPTVAAADDGTVGILFYDFRNYRTYANGLDTDVWFVWSRDGQTWTEEHLAGPFDVDRAPDAGGLFLGDYVGMAASEHDFHAIFTMATPTAREVETDIYHARVSFAQPAAASGGGTAVRGTRSARDLPATGVPVLPVAGSVLLIVAAALRRWRARGA